MRPHMGKLICNSALKRVEDDYIGQRARGAKDQGKIAKDLEERGRHITKSEFITALQQDRFTVISFDGSTYADVQDADGYKYRFSRHTYKSSQNHKRFGKNPFVVFNVEHFLTVNYPNLIWLDRQYLDCKHGIRVICRKHQNKGEQLVYMDSLINGNANCKYCSFEQRVKRVETSRIQKRCEELGLMFVGRSVRHQSTDVLFLCPKHKDRGVQRSTWDHFATCAVGCTYCTGRHKTTDEFRAEIYKILPTVKIIGSYRGSENPVKCVCTDCGTVWAPRARSLKTGQGCPICKSSKGETVIAKYLLEHSIRYATQHSFSDCLSPKGNPLKFDFYLPDKNIIIEYDGEQHFAPVDFKGRGLEDAKRIFIESKQRDEIKNQYCQKHDIHLIRIPYNQINQIDEILTRL